MNRRLIQFVFPLHGRCSTKQKVSYHLSFYYERKVAVVAFCFDYRKGFRAFDRNLYNLKSINLFLKPIVQLILLMPLNLFSAVLLEKWDFDSHPKKLAQLFQETRVHSLFSGRRFQGLLTRTPNVADPLSKTSTKAHAGNKLTGVTNWPYNAMILDSPAGPVKYGVYSSETSYFVCGTSASSRFLWTSKSGQAMQHACSFSSLQFAQRTSRVKSWTR